MDFTRSWVIPQQVGYFEFALDPEDFSQSVENMFHISFLVMAGKVWGEEKWMKSTPECQTFLLSQVLFVVNEETELPELSIIDTSEATSKENDQVITTINKRQWRELVQLLDIKWVIIR